MSDMLFPGRYQAAGLALAVLFGLGLSFPAAADAGRNAPRTPMTAFESDAALLRYLKRHKWQEHFRFSAGTADVAAAPAAAEAPASGNGESITNTQEAGIDEGGIVKMRGDALVILRRGRLFTVSTRDGGTTRC
jgi:hypothetical protein